MGRKIKTSGGFITKGHASLTNRENEANEILELAVKQFKPSHIFGMFSGGHDSLTATHFASRLPNFAAFHANTGIGIEATREFVRATCEQFDWTLYEYKPPLPPWATSDETAYEALVRKFGFPGPAMHRLMYNRLKDRCVAKLIADFKISLHDRILLVTGVRREESTRRMGILKPFDIVGCRVWVAPIISWSNENKNDYIEKHGLPKNKVVKRLCMSGECLCGAFAKPNEIVEIRHWYPEVADYLDKLEKKVACAGKHAKWGEAPPRRKKHAGLSLRKSMEMCWSCESQLNG